VRGWGADDRDDHSAAVVAFLVQSMKVVNVAGAKVRWGPVGFFESRTARVVRGVSATSRQALFGPLYVDLCQARGPRGAHSMQLPPWSLL
jgi:hypothetical protein